MLRDHITITGLNSVISDLHDRGASAVLSVVSPEREEKLNSGFNIFDDIPSGKMGIIYDSQKTNFECRYQSKPEETTQTIPAV